MPNGIVKQILSRDVVEAEIEVCLPGGELEIVAVHDPLYEIQPGDSLRWDDMFAIWSSHYDPARGSVYMGVRNRQMRIPSAKRGKSAYAALNDERKQLYELEELLIV